MPPSETRLISLLPAQAAFVESAVKSGDYASLDDVVDAALRALQARDEVNDWLCDEVVPVVDAMNADPALGLTPEQVKSALLERHRARIASDAA